MGKAMERRDRMGKSVAPLTPIDGMLLAPQYVYNVYRRQ
jgi:hypothetical protein